jgi:hypothetical protein
MAARTQVMNYPHPTPAPFLVLSIVVLAVLAIPTLVQTVHTSLHTEADQIRQCAEDPTNLNQVWLNSSGERLNCIIDLSGNKVGDYVIQFCRRSGWIEVTAYIIGDGSLARAISVLRAKGCQQVYP